jgi:hypothetical protein
MFTQRSAATSPHALEKRAGQNLMITLPKRLFSCQQRLRAGVVPQIALQHSSGKSFTLNQSVHLSLVTGCDLWSLNAFPSICVFE